MDKDYVRLKLYIFKPIYVFLFNDEIATLHLWSESQSMITSWHRNVSHIAGLLPHKESVIRIFAVFNC